MTNTTNQPEKPQAAKSVKEVDPAETPESTQKSAIEIKVDNAVEMLNTYSSAITDNVSAAKTVTTALNPGMAPIRTLCTNLGITENLDKLDTPAITAVSDALVQSGLSADIWLNLLEAANTLVTALPVINLDNLDITAPSDIATNLRDLVKAAMWVDVSQAGIDAAKAALARFEAAKRDLDQWNNQSKRAVPSQTGTKGPKPGGNVGRGGTGQMAADWGWQFQYECDTCGNPAYTGASGSSRSKAVSAAQDAIKRHLVESHQMDWYGPNSDEHRTLHAALETVADEDTSVNVVNGVLHRVAA